MMPRLIASVYRLEPKMSNAENASPPICQKMPFKESVVEGRTYWWCACGRSKKQPFCDGSHAGTGFQPVAHKAKATGDAYFCGCKRTEKAPLCDGTHARLP